MISKFRAWYGYEMYDEPVVYNGKFYLDWRDFEDGREYDGAILMQSTGFRDKNGVEVFEGDVVKHSNMKKALVCRYFEERASFMAMSLDGYHWVNFYDTEKWEIIGNLYENPELLETHAIFGSICENTSENTGSSQ